MKKDLRLYKIEENILNLMSDNFELNKKVLYLEATITNLMIALNNLSKQIKIKKWSINSLIQ